MAKRSITLLAVAILATLAACSDDATRPDDSFLLMMRVIDEQGAPLPDMELLVVMDSPYYQEGRIAQKAAVRLDWNQPVEAEVALTIEDVAGVPLRLLVAGPQAAGRHAAVWDGRDDQGLDQASGLYRARLLVRSGAGQLLHDERQPMYLALLDFHRGSQGATDAAGELRLTDRRLFPRLFGEVAMLAYDGSASPIGPFPLVHRMRFYLRDPLYGHVERFDREVTGSGQTVILTWIGVDGGAEPPTGPRAVPLAPAPVDTGFRLYPPYPNPFN